MSFTDFNTFEKDTVLLNSDRVILNSKDDSVFILSKKTVGTSAAESVHFDIGPRGSKDKKYMFIVNSPYIQFGLGSNTELEPITKANSTVALMEDLFSALNTFTNAINGSTALGVGVATLPQITTAAYDLKLNISNLKLKYLGENSPLKSKIAKTI